LLRPGRFDRQVVVPLPDIRGREEILKVHMRKVPIAGDVKADIIARGTPVLRRRSGQPGQRSRPVCRARNKRLVDMDDFEMAKDKIMMGAERRSMVMTEEEKRNTAYHESGHAVVAKLVPKSDPVHKVTIIPRGRALGLTMQLPEGPLRLRPHLPDEPHRSAVRRAHRRRTVHEPDDDRCFQRLRAGDAMARDMVTRYGMSDSWV
jgi:cell division protease FtsH